MSGRAPASPVPRRWWQALAGNLGWLLASNGLMAALSLIYIGIITRTLGIADFGRFALITSAAQMLAVLVSFETWKIIVQYGLEHEARGDRSAMVRLVQAAIRMELASAALGMAGVALLFALWGGAFGLSDDVRPYAFGYAAVQLLALRSTPTGLLRLRDRYDSAALADSVQPVGRLLGSLAALIFWPTIQGFLLAYALAELLTAVVCWLLALRTADRAALRRQPFSWRDALVQNVGIWRFMWSTNLQSSLGLAARQVPLLLVGGFDGPAAAGAFRLAMQMANALSKISTLVMRAAFPEIVRSIHRVSREGFWRLVGRMALGSFAGAAVVMLVVVMAGRSLLTLIGGSAFGDGYVLLLWLAGAGCVELAAAAFEPILLSVRRAGAIILARGGAVAIQFAAMALLLPLFGAWGASVSVLLGAGLAALFLGIALARYAPLHGAQ
ncbi:MAG TPA: lipopolysaccharide biosynthesis protein [Sphingobium sp.]|nr:lipopolysaccharide biosynthesis protein [Sphingobium sp.]